MMNPFDDEAIEAAREAFDEAGLTHGAHPLKAALTAAWASLVERGLAKDGLISWNPTPEDLKEGRWAIIVRLPTEG